MPNRHSSQSKNINIPLKLAEFVSLPGLSEVLPPGANVLVVIKPNGQVEVGLLHGNSPMLLPINDLKSAETILKWIENGKIVKLVRNYLINQKVKSLGPVDFKKFKQIFKVFNVEFEDDGYKAAFEALKDRVLNKALSETTFKRGWFSELRWLEKRIMQGVTISSYKSFFFPRKWENQLWIKSIEELKLLDPVLWKDSRLKLAYLLTQSERYREKHMRMLLKVNKPVLGFSRNLRLENLTFRMVEFGRKRIENNDPVTYDNLSIVNSRNLELLSKYIEDFDKEKIFKILMRFPKIEDRSFPVPKLSEQTLSKKQLLGILKTNKKLAYNFEGLDRTPEVIKSELYLRIIQSIERNGLITGFKFDPGTEYLRYS